MPKLQAAVPPGAPPNALLRVRLPDGNEVNVRVPKGLKPGDEFIFEVNTSGGVVGSGSGASTIAEGIPKVGGGVGGTGSTSASGGKKSDKSHSNNKQVSKNPKKKSKGIHSDNQHNSGGGGASSLVGGRGGDSSNNNNIHNAGGGGGGIAPSFVTQFFNIYNQVYDILSQVNESNTSSTSSSTLSLQRKSSTGSSSCSNPHSSTFQSTALPSSTSYSDLLQTTIDNGMDDALTSTTTTKTPRRLLDKEIISYDGLMVSLIASIFIGCSILVGFVGGVLYVTPPEDIAQRRW